jgi:enolase-phosphatase E1
VSSNAALRAIVLDIEGTTTPIAFVYETLFPYARAHVRTFLDSRRDDAAVSAVIEHLRADQTSDTGAPASVAEYVEWAMDRDRKSTALKELQGLIWADGYARGELNGEVFPDVVPALSRWRDCGLDVAIFSSGSVLAQQLLFGHSNAGDLTPLVRWHFDTTTGPKTSAESYARIAAAIGIAPRDALFISDAVPELDAASAAGMQTRLADRPGNREVPSSTPYTRIRTFDEVRVDRMTSP